MDIPGYDDLREIGRGGFAVVFSARQVAFDRRVAIKVLATPGTDEDRRRRFDRECAAMGRLGWHPNIVHVYEAGHTGLGQPYLVMEELAEGSLADQIQRSGPMPWEEALPWTIQLCGALAAAHGEGVLHRDLKPENVLLDGFGEVKLTDFGIAALTGATATATGMVTASVAHAAPEVLNGGRATVASDVYSLGSTLYFLLSGMLPFVRDTDESIVPAVVRATSEPVPDLRPAGVPDAVASVVEQAMAKEPEERPDGAEALAERLRTIQGEAGLVPTALRTTRGTGAMRAAATARPVAAPLDRRAAEAAPDPVEAAPPDGPDPAGPADEAGARGGPQHTEVVDVTESGPRPPGARRGAGKPGEGEDRPAAASAEAAARPRRMRVLVGVGVALLVVAAAAVLYPRPAAAFGEVDVPEGTYDRGEVVTVVGSSFPDSQQLVIQQCAWDQQGFVSCQEAGEPFRTDDDGSFRVRWTLRTCAHRDFLRVRRVVDSGDRVDEQVSCLRN